MPLRVPFPKMGHTTTVSPRAFVQDALVATLVLAGLYGLAQGVQFQPVQIPGYLLVVGFDVLEGLFGAAGANYWLLFAAYVLGLGAVAAALSAVVRTRTDDADRSTWRTGAAGALAVLGTLSVLYGVVILVGTTQLAPVLITGTVGVALLLLASWLADVWPTTDR